MNHDEAIRELSKTVSQQEGQLSALMATLVGIVASGDLGEIGRAAVVAGLDQAHAVHNGGSTNPVFMASFEAMRDHLLAALSAAPTLR